jgi:ketosteroid isomerase-like protein
MVRRVRSVLVFIGLLVVLARPAFSATTSMDVVQKALAACATLEPSAFDGLYANEAVFVDEGPYIGYGSNAGHAWAEEIHRRFAQRKMTQFAAVASKPIEAQEKGDEAYVVVPLKLDGRLGNGAHYHEDGAFTFTLHREAGDWKITSQVWTVLARAITPKG